jgi:acid phosphatase
MHNSFNPGFGAMQGMSKSNSRRVLRSVCIALSMLLVSACEPDPVQNDLTNSVIWSQSAAEYTATVRQTYAAATRALDMALSDAQWNALEHAAEPGAPTAVIMDIDETILSNAEFRAQLALDNAPSARKTMDSEWLPAAMAKPLPGAIEFISYATAKGVEVIFVTNRRCRQRTEGGPHCPQEADTIKNLRKAGIDFVTTENLHLRGEPGHPEWSSDKETRRKFVANSHRVLLLLGDDLNDFLPCARGDNVEGCESPKLNSDARRALVEAHLHRWGHQWFIFPNPMYGNWLNAAGRPAREALQGYR